MNPRTGKPSRRGRRPSRRIRPTKAQQERACEVIDRYMLEVGTLHPRTRTADTEVARLIASGQYTAEQLEAAVRGYAELLDATGRLPEFRRMPATFFGRRDQFFVRYLPQAKPEPGQETPHAARTAPPNRPPVRRRAGEDISRIRGGYDYAKLRGVQFRADGTVEFHGEPQGSLGSLARPAGPRAALPSESGTDVVIDGRVLPHRPPDAPRR